MLIAWQNDHIDQAPWKKPAGPVKEKEKNTKRELGPDLQQLQGPRLTPTQTHTGLIHFNESWEEHKGITSINAKSIQHNRGYMQKISGVLVSAALVLFMHMGAQAHVHVWIMCVTKLGCKVKWFWGYWEMGRVHPCIWGCLCIQVCVS